VEGQRVWQEGTGNNKFRVSFDLRTPGRATGAMGEGRRKTTENLRGSTDEGLTKCQLCRSL